MELIKCPECRREISDEERKCPYCGFDIKEIESDSKKARLTSVIKKVCIAAIILIIFIVGMGVAGSHAKMKQFEGYVDKFVEDWDKMIKVYREESEDLLYVDVSEKMLCSDMRKISRAYVELGKGNKTKANEYLEEHTFKDMFEYVMELKIEKNEPDIEQEFVDFYTNMER